MYALLKNFVLLYLCVNNSVASLKVAAINHKQFIIVALALS